MTAATAEVITAEAAAVERAENASGRAGELLLEAQSIVVQSDTYESASAFLRGVKQLGKEIEAERKSLTDPLNSVVKRIMDKFRPASDACAKAESVVKGKLTAYAAEVERQRQAAEQVAREAQQKEQDRLNKLAAKAEERGDTAKAEQFTERAAVVAMAPVVVTAPKPEAEGISYRTTYRAEVTDLKALCAAVLVGTVPAEAIVANEKFLGQAARSLKGAVNWPGVRWIAEKTLAAKA